ncbi:helix-turn-helix domain-containing protein [Levilactobacillus brevis]|uniref:helix-turn-helix domain-containing protein n=1 Tax=Levilactobacillus brevis TaxID=1580 RepID=UPI00046337B2|nr:helix-turn-helix transcriptional regulator [Levilactobacillus brevis]
MTTDELNQLGQQIKTIRVNLGLTMEEFIERVDGKSGKLRSGTVNNWENGKNAPNKKRLAAIAKLGNVTVEYLLHGPNFKLARKSSDAFEKLDESLGKQGTVPDFEEKLEMVEDFTDSFIAEANSTSLDFLTEMLGFGLQVNVAKDSLLTEYATDLMTKLTNSLVSESDTEKEHDVKKLQASFNQFLELVKTY